MSKRVLRSADKSREVASSPKESCGDILPLGDSERSTRESVEELAEGALDADDNGLSLLRIRVLLRLSTSVEELEPSDSPSVLGVAARQALKFFAFILQATLAGLTTSSSGIKSSSGSLKPRNRSGRTWWRDSISTRRGIREVLPAEGVS